MTGLRTTTALQRLDMMLTQAQRFEEVGLRGEAIARAKQVVAYVQREEQRASTKHRADEHRADEHRADEHRAHEHRADEHRAAGTNHAAEEELGSALRMRLFVAEAFLERLGVSVRDRDGQLRVYAEDATHPRSWS